MQGLEAEHRGTALTGIHGCTHSEEVVGNLQLLSHGGCSKPGLVAAGHLQWGSHHTINSCSTG